VAWAATMFQLSSRAFAGGFTAWLLHQILSLFDVKVSPDNFATLHFLLRKLAHLTEYAIFGLLLYGCFNGGKRLEWHPRKALWSLAIAAGFSVTDEYHQRFIPGRGASLLDCTIDTLGAVLGVIFLYARERYSQMRSRRMAARKESPAET